eukprot:COSAG01_NODE_27967_length_672_cov_1.521815_1_plen_195_part_10
MFSGAASGEQEWISVTPWGVLLQPHNSSEPPTEWHSSSWNGYPSSNPGNTKTKMTTTSIPVGQPNGRDAVTGVTPPRSTMDVGYTSYLIEHDAAIADNAFFLQSPSYIRYYLPACPNFAPGDTLSAACPTRQLRQAEWKFSVLGLLHGANINSLKPSKSWGGSPPPPHEAPVVKDIAQHKTMIYRMVLDIGAMAG